MVVGSLKYSPDQVLFDLIRSFLLLLIGLDWWEVSWSRTCILPEDRETRNWTKQYCGRCDLTFLYSKQDRLEGWQVPPGLRTDEVQTVIHELTARWVDDRIVTLFDKECDLFCWHKISDKRQHNDNSTSSVNHKTSAVNHYFTSLNLLASEFNVKWKDWTFL